MSGMTASDSSQPARISFILMAVALVLIAWLHLGVLVLTMLFSYFALQRFSLGGHKALGVAIYILVVAGLIVGLGYFTKNASTALPDIAEKTIPAIAEFAEKQKIDLPFTDYASLKTVVLAEVKDRMAGVGHVAKTALFEIAQLIVGLVAAASLFLNIKWGFDQEAMATADSLYTTVVRELSRRGATFYKSFSTVMSAQIIISSINTTLTAGFVMINGFPHAVVIIVLTFLCGLLPIIGNIISNTLIAGVAFTISPKMAIIALVYLVVIHKLEYFLNSKIIGDRIKNPMWLTLIGIMLGEKLMGIPGMILAPVVLHYIKVEASRNKVSSR
jgi:predicted PurR-regulated permease PerM